jgi:hypothetical protein
MIAAVIVNVIVIVNCQEYFVTRYRNFGSPVQSDEVVVFDLYGEQYKCKASLQGRVLIELVARADAENTADAAAAVLHFFDAVMVDESRQRFTALTQSEDKVVSLETLTEIMQWLVEQYAGGERPTTPSSDSLPGETTTGLPLMEGQYSPVPVSTS